MRWRGEQRRRSAVPAQLLALAALVGLCLSAAMCSAQAPEQQGDDLWAPYESSFPSMDEEDEVDNLSQSVDEDHLAPPAPEFEFPIAQGRRIPYASGFLSRFWGIAGERFNRTDRMSDWSWAGYRMGEREIPNPPALYNLVTDFGATPDDERPDTAAFQAAFTRVPAGGVLFIPPGRFIVDQKLARNRSIVIRGAGQAQTRIFFSKSLTDLQPWKATAASPLSPYRDDPYLISFAGPILTTTSATLIGNVSANARRGDVLVQVRLAPGTTLAPGLLMRIVASDRNLSLVRYMYGGMTEEDMRRPATDVRNANNLLLFNSRLRSWSTDRASGLTTLELERHLAFDLRPFEWRNVQVHRFPANVLTESGIEDITFEFKPSRYPGHLIEEGYNTMGIRGCVHCWARRLTFLNVDFGLHMEQAAFITVEHLTFDNTTDRSTGNLQKFDGHHAVRLARATDCLVRHMKVDVKFIHDVTVDVSAILNVYHNVTARDLSMDYHSRMPTMNLMSRMNCGRCMRTWASGGSATSGAHAGMLNMAWGLHGGTPATNIQPMWRGFGQSYTIIGAPLNSLPSHNDFMFEALDPTVLLPWDLQASQLQWRLQNTQPVPELSLATDNVPAGPAPRPPPPSPPRRLPPPLAPAPAPKAPPPRPPPPAPAPQPPLSPPPKRSPPPPAPKASPPPSPKASPPPSPKASPPPAPKASPPPAPKRYPPPR